MGDHSVQPLPNYFGLLLFVAVLVIVMTLDIYRDMRYINSRFTYLLTYFRVGLSNSFYAASSAQIALYGLLRSMIA